MMKKCCVCNIEKEYSDFTKNYNICKNCRKKKRRESGEIDGYQEKIVADFLNKKIGKLKLIETYLSFDDEIRDRKRRWWKCICDCGIKIDVRHDSLTKDKPQTSCGCDLSYIKSGKESHLWLGVGDMPSGYFSHTKYRALKKGLEFNITKEYIWDIYEKQHRKCALSGRLIVFSKKTELNTASLDRIDSSKGYVKGNVQWLDKDINKMKWNFDQKYLIEMCKEIARNN